MRKIILTLIAVSLITMAGGASFPSAVFHAEFDKDFSAHSNKGELQGKHSQEILWETIAAYLQPGVVGKGALVGTGDDGKKDFHIEYPNKDFFSPEKGAVAFWINPVDWRHDDKNFHIFFRARGKDSDLIVYKGIWPSDLLFLIGPTKKENGKNVWTVAKGSIRDWKPGNWYFVTAVWGEEKAALYVNGKQLGVADYKVVPDHNFTSFGVGGLTPMLWTTPQNFSIIDDLMIYDRALTPAEVLARFSSYGSGLLTDDPSIPLVPEKIFSMHDPLKNEFIIKFMVSHSEPDGTPYRVSAEIKDQNGKGIWREIICSKTASYQLAVQQPVLAAGSYRAELKVLKKDDSVRGETTYDFTVPAIPEVWRDNEIGLDKQVPPPWSKPEWDTEKAEFRCWNRQYIFGESALPEQIVSGGEKLLSAPISLRLNDQVLNLSGGKVRDSDEESVVLESNSIQEKLNIEVVTKAEFDGFIWFELRLNPTAPIAVDHLTLDIPFHKESSELFNSMAKNYLNYQPGDQGIICNYSMNLYTQPRCMFIGNDRGGLEWFCEELSSWYNKKPSNSLQVIVGESSNILRLNLIDYPVKIDKELRYSFGIQATPVKPLPPKWRLRRIMGGGENSFDPWFPWETLHNVPDSALVKKDYHKELEKKLAENPQVLHYFAGFTNSPYTPEWTYYGGVWSKQPPALGHYGILNDREWAFAWNCPREKTYRDYYLYGLDKTIGELNIRNLYFDNQDAQLCGNSLHGCGWTGTDGKSYETYNLRSTRELAKRIYKVLKARNPNGIIMRHASAKMVTPVTGFADCLADGELYNGTVARDESYRNIFESGMFRASFRSQPFGVPNYFIPQFQRAIKNHSTIPKRYENAWLKPEDLATHSAKLRHFTGYFLVHDALVWANFGISMKKWWQVQDKFGFDGEETFIMYNDPLSPFKTSPNVLASCYLQDDKMLIIVMNLSEESKVQVELKTEQLGKFNVSTKKIVDAESGDSLELVADAIELEVLPGDYRILSVR